MDINISENLKKFRREKGNTQEDLATHLGISMQAVSKWERGESYPDITLIPAIALYYNVTSDRLLGMDEKAVEAKIKEYKAKALEVQNQIINGDAYENQVKQIALWREAQKEFPNNHKILYRLLVHLGLPVCNSANDFEEIVQIGERLLAESTDNEIRFTVINLLCDAYANHKDFENAKRYANMSPSYYNSKEILYGHCLSGEERIKYRQGNIRSFIGAIHEYFIQDMMRDCGLSLEEVTKMYEFAYKLYHLLYNDGDFGYYHLAMDGICFNLAKFHSAMDNTNEALSYLNEMAEHCVKSDQYLNMQGEFKHTSFMINRLISPDPTHKLAKDTARVSVMRDIKQIENTKSFDCIRNDERYKTAVEKMKALLQ